jgi:signal transduction histidine kinase
MNRVRPVAMLLALVGLGAVGALLVATALGMKASEVAHLAGLLGPAIVVTVVAAMLASWLLRRTSLRQRYLAIAAVGTVVALGNLLALSRAMFVSAHAATVLAVVLTYASAAGLAAAFAAARSSASALDRVTRTAEDLARGDLSARVGALDAGPELDRLAATLDQMAERLQSLRDQEQRIERTRRDLITAVSHDLRTPLGNLQAMAEAVDERVVEDPETFRRYAFEMRRSVGQLSALVDDLFEFVQADAIDVGAEDNPVTLDEVVGAAVDAVLPEAHRKGLVLATELRGENGACCSPHLARVLQNLLANAVRHTPAGGSVTLDATPAPGALRIAVRDSGEGIEERDLPHVFEPFYRGDPARSGNGAGLGLALADRLVRAMGGSLTATSAGRPSGACFEVLIPANGAFRSS